MGRIAGVGTRLTPPGAGGYTYNTTIDETVVNSEFADLYAEMTNSIACDGSSTLTANIPMGGYTLTGMADATATTSPAALGQVTNKNYIGNSSFQASESAGPKTLTGTECVPCVEMQLSGSSGSMTKAAFTAGQTDVPYYPHGYLAVDVTAGAATSHYARLKIKMEDVTQFDATPYYFTIWAKASASCNFSTEFGQNFGSGGSADVTTMGILKQALTTTWTKFSFPVTYTSQAGKTVGTVSYGYINLWMDAGSDFNARTDTLGHQTKVFYFACPKMERGNTYTRWEAPAKFEGQAFKERYYQSGFFRLYANCTAGSALIGTVALAPKMTHDNGTFTITSVAETNCATPVVDLQQGDYVSVTSNSTAGSYTGYAFTWTLDAHL